MKIGDKGVIGVVASERNNFAWPFIDSLIRLVKRNPQLQLTYSHAGTIPDGRNAILDIAKQVNADYVLFIDSDMTFPLDGNMTLKLSMERHGASIGCGVYFGTYPPYESKPMAYQEKDGRQIPLDSWNEITSITSCGMGFTLITKDLFDLRFRFEPGKGEDHLFCQEARKLGKKLILDPTVKCGHIRTIVLTEEIANKLTKN